MNPEIQQDPRFKTIQPNAKHGYTIFPDLQISAKSYRAIHNLLDLEYESLTSSETFYRAIEGLSFEQFMQIPLDGAGRRPLTGKTAEKIILWKSSYNRVCRNYKTAKQLTEKNKTAEDKAIGHERNYKSASKQVRDEIATAILSGLYAHHGLLVCRTKLIEEAYKTADEAIIYRSQNK